MIPTLTHIKVQAVDGDYRILIETDDDTKFEVSATYEQLDLIAEELNTILDRDEENALTEE